MHRGTYVLWAKCVWNIKSRIVTFKIGKHPIFCCFLHGFHFVSKGNIVLFKKHVVAEEFSRFCTCINLLIRQGKNTPLLVKHVFKMWSKINH